MQENRSIAINDDRMPCHDLVREADAVYRMEG